MFLTSPLKEKCLKPLNINFHYIWRSRDKQRNFNNGSCAYVYYEKKRLPSLYGQNFPGGTNNFSALQACIFCAKHITFKFIQLFQVIIRLRDVEVEYKS